MLVRQLICRLFFSILVSLLFSLPAGAATPMIAAGGNQTCAVSDAGTVQCWGANDSGQLGDGTTTNSAIPVNVMGINDAVSVSTGASHTCAVLRSGKVKCWGDNTSSQLGVSSESTFIRSVYNGWFSLVISYSTTPVTVNGITDAIAVGTSSSASCAVLANGKIKCWGKVFEGANYGVTPTEITGINNAVAIKGGLSHLCALLRTGDVRCWGGNNYGQLGNGSTTDNTIPVIVQGIQNAVAIAAGGGAYTTCAVLQMGNVQCWGISTLDFTTINSTPTTISGVSNAIGVSIGSGYVCALLKNNTVQCWGRNRFSQLGNMNWEDSQTPVAVTGLNDVISIAAGYYHVCALLKTNSVKCWGDNKFLQRGNTSTPINPSSAIPVIIQNINDAKSISMYGDSICTVLGVGTVKCWGNSYGYLYNPISSGINNAISISVGNAHICVVLQNGEVKCWGGIGDGTTTDSATPVTVKNISNAVSVSVGGAHSCATLKDGSVQCWGSNVYGQLGDGTTIDNAIPVTVKEISNAKSISTGFSKSCATLESGIVKCWGYQGTIPSMIPYGNDLIPVTINGIKNAISVVPDMKCVLTQTGTVQCWDTNSTALENIRDAVAFSSNCVALRNGTVQCWGNNDYGQLGNGKLDGIASDTPVTVVGINNAIAVSSNGTNRNCALLSTGSIQCWGNDVGGALGAGALSYLAPNFVMGVGGQGYLNLTLLSQNIDKVLSWAESHFPQFNPSGGISVSDSGYRYRGYQNRYYLGANENGIPHIYYFDAVSMTSFMDVGLLSDFLNLIGN